MQDNSLKIQDLKDKVESFVKDRDWQQFHNPKNLSMAIAVEAGELMEHFLWDGGEESKETFLKKRTEIVKEVADILIVTLALCNRLDIDVSEIVCAKIEEIKKKYPVDKCRGKKDKYTEL